LEVARDLLGKILVHHSAAGMAAGRIVETEAYIGEADPACHAAPGLTARNAPLYGEPGYAYVYLNYGIHYLINAVTEAKDSPAAVLIRALEPVEGIELMRRRRARGTGRGAAAIPEMELCKGPGNLTRALGITLRQNRADLAGTRVYIEARDPSPRPIQWSSRVGIRVGTEHAWRCFFSDSAAVSGRPSTVKSSIR
jgi:DNA-3-methyladenine glycosylase